ncbi:MAG: biotin/lipoyl-binding protein [Bacteroidetes bacterium]|nr:biotin/lipoyl-binding protein [Bacteroidota bacterium]
MKNFKFAINGNNYEVEIQSIEGNLATIEVNGSAYKVEIDREVKSTKTPTLVRSLAVPSTDTEKSTVRTAKPTDRKGTGGIKSPLPGTVLEMHVKVGDQVNVGTKLLVLEAMKMENTINSDKAGTVTSVKVDKGDSVLEGDLLIEIGG